MGRVVKTKVAGMIGSKLTPNNVLVTDAWRAYKTYADEKGIEHYRIKSDYGKHVIKGFISYLKCKWTSFTFKIQRFKVVASKYLDWFLFVDSHSNGSKY